MMMMMTMMMMMMIFIFMGQILQGLFRSLEGCVDLFIFTVGNNLFSFFLDSMLESSPKCACIPSIAPHISIVTWTF
jgi:hypothetical protein